MSRYNEWLKQIFPREVADYIIKNIDDENNPLGDHAQDFCYYTVGNVEQKYYFDETVKGMCCGTHQATIPGMLNGNPVEYVVSWSYGH